MPIGPDEPAPLLQLPADVRPLHYSLALEIVPSRERFAGTVEIEVQLDAPRRILWLHGKDLHVTRALVDAPGGGGPIEASWEQVAPDGVARLSLPRAVGPGKAVLRLAWDAPWGTQARGLYVTREGEERYAVTHFEAIDARRAFPGFDEPAFKTPYDVTLSVPEGQAAIANTPIVEDLPLPGALRRVRFATSKPLPTYLLLWAVGPFDVVASPPLPPNEVRSRPLPLRGIAPKGRGAELAWAMSVSAEIVVSLERYFGISFPYEKLDQIAVPENFGGAMENAGAIVYLESYFLFREGVSAEETKTWIAALAAHEIAHQWFGDLVTLRWWTDVWLNESFAEWMGWRAVEAIKPELRMSILALRMAGRAVREDSLASARSILQPLERMSDIAAQFDDITYLKGGSVLAMFEGWVGAEDFRAGIREYLLAHAHGTGSTDEFLASLDRSSGKPVAAAFRTFLEHPGVPIVEARVACDAKGARVELSQERYLPIGSEGDRNRTWQVPVCARWSEKGTSREGCTLLAGKSGALPIPGGRCPDWVLPNANAAGYYVWSLAPGDLHKLRTSGYPDLSIRERISLAQNVRAAMRSGALSYADGLSALEPIARDADGEVAEQPMADIGFARDYLLPDSLLPTLEEYATRLYRPALQRVGWKVMPGEGAAQRRFRNTLVRFLSFIARDPAVRKEAGRLGTDYSGVDGRAFQSQAVSADLAGTVLAAAVREGAPGLFDALENRLSTEQDVELRGRILGAISATADPTQSSRVLALSVDPRLRIQERMTPWQRQTIQRETREGAWAALQQHFDVLVTRLDEDSASYLPYTGSGFCDLQRSEEVKSFFEARLSTLPQSRLNLAHVVETIRLCAALKEAQRSSAAAFFQAPASAGR
ncbi:MAG: M1 family metallopeptidase [Myxococcales bacterium]